MNIEDNDGPQPDWETCLICGNTVEPGHGAARINHHGTIVNLCGPDCRRILAQEPDRHIASLIKGGWCVVCQKRVGPGPQAAGINHHGDIVIVCGPQCLREFAKEPDPYIARLAKTPRERALREEMALS